MKNIRVRRKYFDGGGTGLEKCISGEVAAHVGRNKE